jgi:putative flippase GtrA
MKGSATRSRRSGNGAVAAAGRLASPESGLLGQGVRFVLAGGAVALVYVATTTLLAQIFGVPFQVALAVGFVAGLCVHFTLQRKFVWLHNERFVLSIHRQAGRYLLLAGAQYGLTALSVAALPSVLGVSSEAVYLGTVVVVSATNFVIFRGRVFHSGPGEVGSAD